MDSRLAGQWYGDFEGTNTGNLRIELDHTGGDFHRGKFYIVESAENLPSMMLDVVVDDSERENEIEFNCVEITLLSPDCRRYLNPSEAKEIYKEVAVAPPEDYKITGKLVSINGLSFTWETSLGTGGSGGAQRKVTNPCSSLPINETSWSDYKGWIGEHASRAQLLYRGQSQTWPLSTTFHRRGRFDLHRFLFEDAQQLRRSLSGIIDHQFDFSNQDNLGALLNLVQHHGYPTPLLDWTRSPYIAAFFAMRNIPEKDRVSNHVRIFIFDYLKWSDHWETILQIAPAKKHLSRLECLFIKNQRAEPQQAETLLTNVVDIEGHIAEKEKAAGTQYLLCVDIPLEEVATAQAELSLMGITEASMFPGLDGICAKLMKENFD